MHDIARATGLSQSTVSYALGNRGHIAKKTRDRVRATARRLGYRPNLFAATLRSFRTKASTGGWPLALLVLHKPDGTWYPTDPVTKSLRETVRARGFSLQSHDFRSPGELRPLLSMLYARGVRGIIVNSTSSIENDGETDWSRFSVVTCGRWDAHSRFHNVRGDSFLTVTALWGEIEARGYRRIGLACCRHSAVILDDLEREGAAAALAARRPQHRIPPFVGPHGDQDGFLAWFAKYRPEAVIGFNDLQFLAPKTAGYSIPGDCVFASIQATLWPGRVAGMSDADGLIGKTVLRLMDSLIRHHESGIPPEPETLLVRPVFQPGDSLPQKGENVAKKSRRSGKT